MFTTYILQSLTTGKYYIGSAADKDKRLIEHNSNKNKSTKNKGPYVVVYSENFQTRSEAYKREMMIKSYKGGNAFKKLINR